jgi:tetratricopeptide (TPR) repeat protein
MNNLALVLRDQGRFDLAEPLYREALDLLRAAYGPRHLRVAIALFNLAAVTEDQGRYADAEPLYREALEIDRQALGDAHAEVAADRMRLGMLLHLDGRSGEAEPLLRDSLARLRAALPPAHPRVADATFNLGTLLVDTKRAADAEPLLDEAVSIRRATYGADDPRTLLAIVTRDRAETALGHPPPLDALVDVRCRPLPGRYRVEVDRAVDRLLIELQRTVDSKAWRDIQSRASCSQKRPGTPAP